MSGENKFHLILQMKHEFGYSLGFNCLLKESDRFTRLTKSHEKIVRNSKGFWKSVKQYTDENYNEDYFNFRMILKYKGE